MSCVKHKDIQLSLRLRKHNTVCVCLESMCEVQVAGNKIQSFFRRDDADNCNTCKILTNIWHLDFWLRLSPCLI